MRIQAKISFPIEADDYVTASEHQLYLEAKVREIRDRFPNTVLAIHRSRQPSRNAGSAPAAKPRSSTGALNDYLDQD